ncbi:MAG: amidase [Armatimonadota bacterium]|nr:amidase [Armatimonadota bacterium]
MSLPEIAFLPAVDLARRVRRAELSAHQVTEVFLERIERLQPRLNAFTQILSDTALDQARAIDEAARRGRPLGPLAGVPVAVKDIVDIAGTTTTAGAHPAFHRVATTDAPLVARLRAAGAVIIGKTGLHEFAYGVTNFNPHFGPVRNPWDPTRIPGGSSGGSAAAVAAGLCAGAVGTDTGGSIRIPASLCGVVGLKPTFGRIPLEGVTPLSWSLDHAGPLARTVEDAALLFEVMAGGDPERAVSAAPTGPPDLRGLRVGVPRPFFWERLDGEVAHLADAAVRALGDLGAAIRDLELPYASSAGAAAAVVMSVEAAAVHERRLRGQAGHFGRDVRTRLLRGFFLSGPDYLLGRKAQRFLRRAFLQVFDQVDALVTPTTPVAATPIAEEGDAAATTSLAMSAQLTRFTNPFNVTGLPALSVPCGYTRAGLPVGVQLVGPPDGEPVILRLAAAYEAAARRWLRPALG